MDEKSFIEKIKEVLSFETGGLLTIIIVLVIKQIFKYIKNKIPLIFQTLISRRISNLGKIHSLLSKLLYKLNAERASLFIFHGGNATITNDSLLMSCKHEVCEEHVIPAIATRRNIKLNELGDLLNKVLFDKQLIIKSVDDIFISNINLFNFLAINGTRSAIFDILIKNDGEPYGLILLEFNTNKINIQEINEFLKYTKPKIIYNL